MKRRALLAAAASALALVATASAYPPHLPSPEEIDQFCFRDMKPCGDPVLLGRPKNEDGRVVIYGYSSSSGTCIDYDHGGSLSGTCGGDAEPPKNAAILINGLNWSVRDNRTTEYTEIAGVLRTDVAKVEVSYRAKGKARQLDAFTYQVAGDVQKKLKASAPFGIFEASAAGCVQPDRFRLTAYNADGKRLGSSRLSKLPNICRNPQPGTSGFIFFGPDQKRLVPSNGDRRRLPAPAETQLRR